jgi:hypothetical protein
MRASAGVAASVGLERTLGEEVCERADMKHLHPRADDDEIDSQIQL